MSWFRVGGLCLGLGVLDLVKGWGAWFMGPGPGLGVLV